jgi:hypothetical protein
MDLNGTLTHAGGTYAQSRHVGGRDGVDWAGWWTQHQGGCTEADDGRWQEHQKYQK